MSKNVHILEKSEFTPEAIAKHKAVILVDKKLVFGDCIYADGMVVKNGEIVRMKPFEEKLLRFLEGKEEYVSTDDIGYGVWGKIVPLQNIAGVIKGINSVFKGKFVFNKKNDGYILKEKRC